MSKPNLSKADAVERLILVSSSDWNLLKAWCTMRHLPVTVKAGEVLSYFVKTTVSPDMEPVKRK